MSGPAAARRGTVATAIAAMSVGSAYLVGIASLARALWVGERVPSTQRADWVFVAAALCLLLSIVAIPFALVARARIRAPAIVASRVPLAVSSGLIVAAVLGVGFALALAFAGSILSIGVG